MKKLLIVITAIVFLNVLYYFYATYPLKKTWDYALKAMSCEIEPEKTEPIRFLYDHKMMYPNTESIVLRTHRYFVFRLGKKAQWTVHYRQSFYDKDGSMIKSYSDDVIFCFEYNESEWVISKIKVYT